MLQYMMNNEDIILNEKSQSQKYKYYVIPLISKVVKFLETISIIVFARG